MAGLFIVLRRRGAAWSASQPLEAQKDWAAHAAFMDALHAEGFVLLAGPLEEAHEAVKSVPATPRSVEVRPSLGQNGEILKIPRNGPFRRRLLLAGSPPMDSALSASLASWAATTGSGIEVRPLGEYVKSLAGDFTRCSLALKLNPHDPRLDPCDAWDGPHAGGSCLDRERTEALENVGATACRALDRLGDHVGVGAGLDPGVDLSRRERVAGNHERGDRPEQPEAGAPAHAAIRTVTSSCLRLAGASMSTSRRSGRWRGTRATTRGCSMR